MRAFTAAVLLAWLPAAAAAQPGTAARVATYPGPPGIAPSRWYSVEVNGRPSFVYEAPAGQGEKTTQSQDTSWTTFSFSGRVTVRVRSLQGPVSASAILPSSRRIQARQEGDSVVFELRRPAKLAVDINHDLRHPMLVFADAPESAPPSAHDPDVLYFPPGVYDLPAGIEIPPGKSVYLAGGAYVRGTMRARAAQGTWIRGRGVLSGERFPRFDEKDPRDAPFRNMIESDWSTRRFLVDGITLVGAPHMNITLNGRGNAVRDVKIISAYYSTDGVVVGPDGVVSDDFIKVNDDSIKLYFQGLRAERDVIWQMENGAPFQLSWNMPSDQSGFSVSDCDVIRVEHTKWGGDNDAVFDALHGGAGRLTGYRFRDIRVENAPQTRLFSLKVEHNAFDHGQKLGALSGLSFLDISVTGPIGRESVIQGFDAAHEVTDVAFQDVVVDGKPLRLVAKDAAADPGSAVKVDAATTEGVRLSGPVGPRLQ